MSRCFRFSLAQTLLLLALAAFAMAIATEIWRHHWGITSNDPALALSPQGDALAMNTSFRPLFHRRHPVLVQNLERLSLPISEFESHRWVVSDVAWSADGRRVISCSGDHTIRFWDALTGDEVQRINTESHSPYCLAVSPDDRLVATGAHPLVKVWDVKEGKAVASLRGHKRWTRAVAFSPDGKYLATACIDSRLQIWETSSWKLVSAVSLTETTRHLEFTSDGRLVTSGYKSKTETEPWECNLSVYEVPSGRLLEELPIRETWAAVSAVALSQDGRLLAAAHGGDPDLAHCAVTIWDFVSKKELTTLEIDDHGERWIDAMAFSADGETLYCGSMDGTVTAQEWRSRASSVLFRRRQFRWKLPLAFALVWLVAWCQAPRLPRPGTQTRAALQPEKPV